jgi:hypothetical protein
MHDMQGDAVAVAAVDLETHRVVLIRLGDMVWPFREVRDYRGCSVHRSGSGYECEVLLCTFFSWVGADLCPPKVPGDKLPVDEICSPLVHQVPRVTSKSPHSRDTMGGRVHYEARSRTPVGASNSVRSRL